MRSLCGPIFAANQAKEEPSESVSIRSLLDAIATGAPNLFQRGRSKTDGSSGSHNQSPLRLRVFLDRAAPKSALTVRGLYNAYCGEEGLKNPTAEESAAFATSCNHARHGRVFLRPAHRRALPKGIELLWLYMLSPRRAPFRSFGGCWLAHERSLAAARGHNKPAGQIPARHCESAPLSVTTYGSNEIKIEKGGARRLPKRWSEEFVVTFVVTF